ncbi:MAG: hypothetical protein HOP31_12890 [Ignavibacteria bacterium]|nr:hypothetical protein [Ignavibacteria bacterium]
MLITTFLLALNPSNHQIYCDRYTNDELKVLCQDIQPLIFKQAGAEKPFYTSQPKQSLFHFEVNRRDKTGYREFFFGGSASPGKSTAIRWQAHKDCWKYPGLRVLILRNTFPELQRTHLDLINFDLPPAYGSYNSQRHTFYYSNGSILEFGYCEKEKDFDKYLSANYDIIMLDEGTTINFKLYLLLKSRLRMSVAGFTPYMAVVSNPGGKYHKLYKSYFYTQTFDIDFPDELQDTAYRPEQILYIQAYVYDNQQYVIKDPEIIQRLKNLPENERKRFLEGSWDINTGSFYDFNENIHVIDPFEIPEDWLKIADIDYGRTNACNFIAIGPDGNFYIYAEWSHKGGTHSTRALSFYNFLVSNSIDVSMINSPAGNVVLWADVNFFYRRKDDEKSKPPSDYFAKYKIFPKPLHKTRDLNNDVSWRVMCNNYIAELLQYEYTVIKQEDEHGIVKEIKDKLIVQPKLYIFRNKCPKLIATLPELVRSEHNQDDVEKDDNIDHWHDSIKSALVSYRPKNAQKKKKVASTAYYDQLIKNSST